MKNYVPTFGSIASLRNFDYVLQTIFQRSFFKIYIKKKRRIIYFHGITVVNTTPIKTNFPEIFISISTLNAAQFFRFIINFHSSGYRWTPYLRGFPNRNATQFPWFVARLMEACTARSIDPIFARYPPLFFLSLPPSLTLSLSLPIAFLSSSLSLSRSLSTSNTISSLIATTSLLAATRDRLRYFLRKVLSESQPGLRGSIGG